jgi:hypothetical protein
MGLPGSDQAFELVWDFSNFQWYMIPFLLVLIYMIAKEIQKENWSALLAAGAFWLMDFINELWNAIVYKETGAAFWSTPGARVAPGVNEWVPNSSLVVLVGWNIEIIFMFFMMGIVSTKMFKGTIQEELTLEGLEQKAYRKKRLINRLVMVFSMTALCVIVEIILNLIGVLIWEWDGTTPGFPNIWSVRNPILIYLIGYLHFWTISAIVYDCKRRWVQFAIVGGMAVIAFGTFITLATIPGYLAPIHFY